MTAHSTAVELEVFSNLFTGIAEHMSATVERTAFTSFVKETHDFGAAICDPDGWFFAYPRQTGVTTFVGLDVGDAIRAVDEIHEGDIIFTNDPYNSGALCSHLPDLHMFRPVFYEGEIICYTWGFIHSSDIGGIVAGSIAPSAYEVYQEGLRLPPLRLFKDGEVDEDLKRVIQNNVRIPVHVWGDLEALRAAFIVAEQHILDVVRRFGLEKFKQYRAEVQDYAERKARDVIAKIPDGSYSFTDYMEDDFNEDVPVRVTLTLTKEGTNATLDYTGTDPQVLASINIPTLGKRHAWITVGMVHYILSIDPSIPVNAGLVRPLSVVAPEGTLINPVFPASFGARVVSGVKMLEVTLGALGKAMPGRIPAAGSGQGMIVVLATPNLLDGGQRVNVLQPLIGGSGARPSKDGFDGTDYTFAFLRNTPIEVLEAENPVLVHHYGFRQDSAGPGRFRGGMGLDIEFETILPKTRLTARAMERTRFAPWGTMGGLCGATTAPCEIVSRNGTKRSVQKIDILEFEVGDVVRIQTSGAGGFGDPRSRSAELIADDLSWGFISPEAAEKTYGAVLDPAGNVDIKKTRSNRVSQDDSQTAVFEYGPEREEFEHLWPRVIHDELQGRLASYPALLRGSIKNMVVKAFFDTGKAPATMADLDTLWSNITKQLPAMNN